MRKSRRNWRARAPASGGSSEHAAQTAQSPDFWRWSTTPNRASSEIDIDEYQKMPRDGHVLIDVREDHEWAAGHAAGAIHLGKGIIERDIETKVPDKSTTMVLYCGGGFRSALAADALAEDGL